MEGAFHGHDADPVGLAIDIEMAARGLDRTLKRLGAGIGEEGLVGEGRFDEACSKTLLAGDLIEVGQVPELLCLPGEGFHEMGMRMAERANGDAGCKIEISLALVSGQPHAFPALEAQRYPIVGFIKRCGRCHFRAPELRSPDCRSADPFQGPSGKCRDMMPKTKTPPLGAARAHYLQLVVQSQCDP